MDKIILIGASDHCRYTIDIIEQEDKYEIYGILDQNLRNGEFFEGYKVLGYIDVIPNLIRTENIRGGIIVIGDNAKRKKVYNEIIEIEPKFHFVNAIHPSVIFGKDVNLGCGCVIMAGVIVNNNCIIGNHSFLATKASLDHDSQLNNFSSLAPGVTTGGRVHIGESTAIGIGATILHYKNIGDYCVIGGSSLVNKDIESYSLAYGIPAKIIKRRDPDEKYL